MGELGDVDRVASAVVVVGACGVDVLRQRAAELRVRAAHGSFHLVEHHTLEHKRRRRVLGVLELQAVALLLEVVLGDFGEEHRVQVHGEQVVVVRDVARGEGVHGEVWSGHGVHERVQRALEHVEEGVAHRVLLRAAQHGVLEDVRDAGGVGRGGAEGDVERVVGVVTVCVKVLGACLVVGEGHRRDVEVLDKLDLGDSEAVEPVPLLQRQRVARLAALLAHVYRWHQGNTCCACRHCMTCWH
mmetsp:Transcript_20081/g.38220  ORF Transcript_20081/g.38220 Transcript_20081/m.38220 type:complete len:243 (-) Transcript_20081:187-915(-)